MSLRYMILILFILPSCQSGLLSSYSRKMICTTGGHFAAERFGRSMKLVDIGAAAVTTLMKGAVKIRPQVKGFNNYMKRGTATTAYREFITAVNPEKLMKWKRKYGRAQLYRGEAGDRIIYYTAVDRLAGNKPTITIYDPKRSSTGNSGNASDKIIYE